MAQRGLPSTAHEYDVNGQCIHCGMYQVNVVALSHMCTPEREHNPQAINTTQDQGG